jgi:uncharacterized protein (TIGR02270 family)
MKPQRTILSIVEQHAEDAGTLQNVRARLVVSPASGIEQLADLDERIDAHIDGLTVAGDAGWRAAAQHLGAGDFAAEFPACALAIESRDETRLEQCLSLAETTPGTYAVLLNAFGWVSSAFLEGTVATLLSHASPTLRSLGLAICAVHRVDPGPASVRLAKDMSPAVRSSALRAAGELGRSDLLTPGSSRPRDADAACRFWAAWSSVLLGNRGADLDALRQTGLEPGPERARAFRLTLQAMSTSAAHGVLQQLAVDPAHVPWLIQGAGIVGDPNYVPWLTKHIAHEKTARFAGEAFSLITGADLERLRLDSKRPADFESGPNDNPADPNVDMDPDEGLPWPDAMKIERWWTANSSRFQNDTRFFMGAPVTREHCIDVLKNGYQRQRILAAHYLCLLDPGTPLFNTSAPAWRQQRLLAKMT